MRRKVIFALLAAVVLMLCAGALAEGFTIDQNGTITGYSGKETNLVIPDTIDGIKVTAIGDSAFEVRTKIVSITIPDGVVSIGQSAFSECYGLTNITIPDSVVSISKSAFSYCDSLESITIPDGVKSIQYGTFNHCESLKDVTLPDNLISIGYGAFRACISLENITIPDRVTSIDVSAFYDCSALKNITIGSSVKSIGTQAFDGCSSLESVIIPPSVTSLGNNTFRDCESLTHFVVMGNTISIDFNTFMNDVNLKYVSFMGENVTLNSNVFGWSDELHLTFKGNSRPKVYLYGSFGTMDPASITVYCCKNSDAASWAAEESYNVVYLDAETAQPIDKIILQEDCRMPVGSELAVEYYVFPAYDASQLTWASSDEEIVSVSDAGVVHVLTAGETTVTCSALNGDACDSMTVTAYVGAESFDLSESEVWIVPQETLQLTVENLEPENVGAALTWSSSNTSRAAVDQNGFVTAKGIGNVTITAKYENGVSRSCLIHVHYPVTKVEFASEQVEVPLKETTLLTVNVTADTQDFVNSLVSFASSDPDIVSVDENGYVMGHQLGSAIITASSENGFSDSCIVTVTHEHEWVIDKAVNASCTETGLTEGKRCSVCLHVETAQEVIPAKGHTEVTDDAVEPTCTETGLSEGAHCSDCGEVLITQEVIPAKGHTEVTDDAVEPSCTETGLSEGAHCSDCGEVLITQEVIPAKGHTEVTDDAVEPTCTETGLTEGSHCSDCGEVLIAQEVIPAGHSYSEWTTTKEATLFETGLRMRTCSACGKIEKETIPVLEFTEEMWDRYGRASFRVVDAKTNAPISGAQLHIKIVDGENVLALETGTDGKVTQILPVGTLRVTAYAPGMLVRNLNVKVTGGECVIPTIGLSDTDTVSADVKVDEMTLDEIIAAGIDVTDPDNQHVYKYAVQLEFTPEIPDLNLHWFLNLAGKWPVPPEIVPFGGGEPEPEPDDPPSPPWVLDDTGPVPRITHGPVGRPPIVSVYPVSENFYLVVYGEVSWLKEMFHVEMIVFNHSFTDTIEDCTVTLDLPDGLSLASMTEGAQKLSVNMGTIKEGGQESVHWYVRGDKEGSYSISASLRGTMQPFEEQIERTYQAKDSINVMAGSAMHLTYYVPEAAYYGDPYVVRAELENVSDKNLYNVSHIITGVKEGKYTHYSDDTVIETVYLESGDTLASSFVEVFRPGDKILIEMEIPIHFESYFVQEQIDAIESGVKEIERLKETLQIFSDMKDSLESLSGFLNGLSSWMDKEEISGLGPRLESMTSVYEIAKTIAKNQEKVEELRSASDMLIDALRTIPVRFDLVEAQINVLSGSTTVIPTDIKMTPVIDKQWTIDIDAVMDNYMQAFGADFIDLPDTGILPIDVAVNILENFTSQLLHDNAVEKLRVTDKKVQRILNLVPGSECKVRVWTEHGSLGVDVLGQVFETDNGAITVHGSSYFAVTPHGQDDTLYIEVDGELTKTIEFDAEPLHTCTGKWYVVYYTTENTVGFNVNVCTTCGKVLNTMRTFSCGSNGSGGGHRFSAYTVDVEPTDTAMGIMTRVCSDCNVLEYELVSAAPKPDYPESDHPYDGQTRAEWTYTHPEEAEGLAVTFSADTEFEEGWDYFLITGADEKPMLFTGKQLQNKTIYVPGSSFTMLLDPDSWGDNYGFAITNIVGTTMEEFEANRFTVNASGVITAYRGMHTELVIPEEWNGIKVTAIGDQVFTYCDNLKSVTIPDSVTTIGSSAFYDCVMLESITLPDSLTSIGDNAFHTCSSLTDITLPDSVTTIGSGAFAYCVELEDITLPDGITTVGDRTFFCCDGLGSITLPDSVTAIGEDAFYSCHNLTEITLSDSVVSIGDYAFMECTNLASITLPDSLAAIGNEAFSNCASLPDIKLPDNIVSVGEDAFGRTFIRCNPNSTTAETLTAANYVFYDMEEELPDFQIVNGELIFYVGTEAEIVIPDGVTSIAPGAFAYNTTITSVTIPNGVTEIGEDTFMYCSSLESVTLPGGITRLRTNVFCGCSSLKDITIPDSVQYIDEWAFESCDSLERIVIPDSVTDIGYAAFSWCSNLEEVTLSDSLTRIPTNAFVYCSNLKSITIPNSVQYIDEQAFEWCESLESITIPDSVQYIDEWAFAGCESLESITFLGMDGPDIASDAISTDVLIVCLKDSEVEEWATEHGYTVDSRNIIIEIVPVPTPDMPTAPLPEDRILTLPKALTRIDERAFEGIDAVQIVIPDGCVQIGSHAFANCENLRAIVIPESTVSIANNAFANCPNVVIYGASGSHAEEYANGLGIPFVAQ